MWAWYLNGQWEHLVKSKLLIDWQELAEILEEGHYILLLEAGQEEPEEETVGQVHLEEEEAYVEEKGLKMVSDTDALRRVVEEVIAANPKSVQDYRGGKDRAIGFLVGQTMKAMKGKADPVTVDALLRELL